MLLSAGENLELGAARGYSSHAVDRRWLRALLRLSVWCNRAALHVLRAGTRPPSTTPLRSRLSKPTDRAASGPSQ
jgi:hypothetical protein